MSEVLYRAAYLRAPVEGSSRKATFVAATENPVDTGFGPEVLRMSGCDLSNYERNPVVLDSHRRGSISDVIGQATVRLEGKQLVAEIEYLDDEDGERALRKVRAGAIRAVSIGYSIDPENVRQVRAGQTVDGVQGPALIVDRWRLIEVSNVPVPADADAIKREAYTRALRGGRMARMDDEDPERMEDGEEPEAERMDDENGEERSEEEPETSQALVARAEEAGVSMEDMAEACDRSTGVIEAVKAGDVELPEDATKALRDLIAARMEEAEESEESEDEPKEDEERSWAGAKAAFVRAAPVELRALAEDVFLELPPKSLTRTWADAVAIAPEWAKAAVMDVIRAKPNATLDHYRSELLKLRAERMKPVGTPDRPTNPTTTTQPDKSAGALSASLSRAFG